MINNNTQKEKSLKDITHHLEIGIHIDNNSNILLCFFLVFLTFKMLIDSYFEKRKKLKKEEKHLDNEELTVTLHKDFKEKEVNN